MSKEFKNLEDLSREQLIQQAKLWHDMWVTEYKSRKRYSDMLDMMLEYFVPRPDGESWIFNK